MASLTAATAHAQGQSVASFYERQTVTLYIGLGVGGGYDLYGRLLARHLGRHIPGNPTVVPKNKTGAGGMVLANSLYNVEGRDGTVLAILAQTAAVAQRLDYQGVKYDASKFSWLGRIAPGNEVVIAWSASGIKSIDDAKKREVTMGATGAAGTSAIYPLLLNNTVGTKFKVVTGYRGMSSTWLGMESGEIDGASNGMDSLRSSKPDWLREKKVTALAQVALSRQPDFLEAPLLYEVATNDLDRQVLRLFTSHTGIGRAIAAPPGVPADRLAALENAFMATMKDPQFLVDAAKMRAEIEPMAARELQEIVGSSVSVSDAVAARAKQASTR
jgi:tripartite-type tricarboxylate transporter receptor subunit TctC